MTKIAVRSSLRNSNRDFPIGQAGKTYSLSLTGYAKGCAMDDYRKNLLKLIESKRDLGIDLKSASLAMKRNHAYLHQFINKGTPRFLEELDRARLARYLGVNEEDLIPPEKKNLIRSPQTKAGKCPVIGEVGAGAEVYPFDDLPLMPNGLHENEAVYVNCDVVDPPPGVYPAGIVALRVKGDSWEPYIREGEILFYETRSQNIADCINEKCIVALTDGRVLFKVLKKGTSYGKYHLISPNAPMMEDVTIEWCAVVTDTSSRLRRTQKKRKFATG